jgi:tetratricopeptide (TPR) repeat protein
MVVAESAVRTRYRVLETLRAYGRSCAEAEGSAAELGRRHAAYYTELAERAAEGLQGPDERAWVDQALPDYDNMRAAFLRARAESDADLMVRLVAALPELAHLRRGYEVSGWAEAVVESADPDHPRFVAAVGVAARGAWNHGEFALARRLATRAGGRVPPPGTARIAYPGDVVADVALYEGDVDVALRHYAGEARRARTDGDRIRLVWTLYYVAVCEAARRQPERGVEAALESLDVADATANPTAQSMARYALGLVLKKSEPDRALALFDEAAELAAAVRNLWWQGIATMEAAATRAVHGDPLAAAAAFHEVIDHWDRIGDSTQQWLNLRYVVRLLKRVDAHSDATRLHEFLVAAGKPSPLDRPAVRTPPRRDPDGSRAVERAAVAHAHAALARVT